MIAANLSGGRDSTAMVIKWLELGNQLDYIIFCDTGFEFEAMYSYIDRLDLYLQRNFNKKITRLDSSKEIERWAFIYPIAKGALKGKLRGLPKAKGRDYCTRETKIKPTRKFLQEKCPNPFKLTCLIGYTHNEVENGRGSNLDYATARYPLHEWGMNEKEVSTFLSKKGIMNPLYNHFERTGCYFCPKQSKASLYALYKHYPKEWQIMKEWEKRAKSTNCQVQTFKPYKSLNEYEREFQNKLDLSFDDVYADYETCFCGK